MKSIEDIRSGAPYYDDFDPTKNFHQMLFNPETAVQARELTGLQSILSHQSGVHARAIYKDGTQVIGGLLSPKKITWIKIESDFGGFPIVVEEFLGKKIIELDSSDAPTGRDGLVVEAKNDGVQKSIFIDTDRPLETGSKIQIEGESVFATVQESGGCFYLGLNAGEFFYNNSFINVPKQAIILEDFNDTPTGTAGLVWTTEVVTAQDDPTLFDPARGSTNYGSPGADRLKTTGTLVYVKEGDPLPDNYSPLYEIREGGTKTESSTTVYSELAKELARRTYDESGNYTVNPFQIVLGDGIWNRIKSVSSTGVIETYSWVDVSFPGSIIISGDPLYDNEYEVLEIIDETSFRTTLTPPSDIEFPDFRFKVESKFSIELGNGKAYVRGFEIGKVGTTQVPVDRARDTQEVQNYNILPNLGNYVIVSELTGNLPIGSGLQSVNLYSGANITGEIIGTAQASYLRFHSGEKGLNSAKYRLYFLTINMNPGKGFEDVRSVGTGAGFRSNIASDSIVSGKTILNASGAGTLLFRIPQEGVATLQPGGVPSTSYSRSQQLTGAATGSSIQFSMGAGSGSTFYGPYGANFAGNDIELNYYHFVNTTTGQVLKVTSLEISNSGQTLTAVFSTPGGNVSAIVPIISEKSTHKTKTITSGTTNAPANALSATRVITLAHYDVKELKSITKGGVDVTDRFIFNTGQTDLAYKNGFVTLKAGQTVPENGTFVISYDYYAHSGTGYFSVDSYPESRKDIPSYRFESSGVEIDLADAIDFRVVGSTGVIPTPGVPISSDYEFYLSRIDAVILSSGGNFGIARGTPAQNPISPRIPDDAMVLYYLHIPPYTKSGEDVQTTYINNRRYTMSDIGKLDKRIGRLEYYTSLSLLEMDTRNKPLYDEAGLERFKNGILVDSFSGHGVGNVHSGDYKCAIDPMDNYCRPPFKINHSTFEIGPKVGLKSNDHSKARIGEVISLPYTEEVFLFNNIATRFESVTPFLVTRTSGNLYLNPPSDDWMDTTSAPALSVNLTGDLDNWEYMLGGQSYSTVWNDWTTVWTGVEQSSHRSSSSFGRGEIFRTNYVTTTTTTGQQRTGTTTSLSSEVIEESIGNYVRDVNIIPTMRAVSIQVIGMGLRPNRDLYVFFEDDNMAPYVVPMAGYFPLSEGMVRSDSNGEVRFTLNIPGGVYRTGDRILTVIDDPQNILDNASTYSKTTFYSSGLNVVTQETIVSTRVPKVVTSTITESRTLTDVQVKQAGTSYRTGQPQSNHQFAGGREDRSRRGNGSGGGGADPIAQSFYVSAEAYPSGMFLTSVDLYMRSKANDSTPLIVQLRPMVNGYPHSTEIIPFSDVIVPPSDIKVPLNTGNINSILAAPTNVKFDAPVYLEPGKEYCIVLESDSLEYETYVATMGQKLLGTDTTIISQISLGSFFGSQNGTTWTAFQNDDLMVRLNKARFSGEGTLTLRTPAQARQNLNLFNHNMSPLQFSGIAEVSPTFQIRRSSTGLLTPEKSYFFKKDTILPEESYFENAGDFLSKLTFWTADPDVSPFLDMTKNSLVTVHNTVNNLGLLREGISIRSAGSGYVPGETSVVVTSSTGSGAIIEPVISGGSLVDLKIVNPGFGYTSTPTISISSASGTGAEVEYHGGFETSPQDGNALGKYITRNIVLREGFEATYLTVQFDLNQVEGTEVQVYYRAKSSEDPEIIDSKNWIKMKKSVNQPLISGDTETYTETTWIPETFSLEYQSGGNTFSSASVIAVKVVFLSNNSVNVPRIKNFRAITSV